MSIGRHAVLVAVIAGAALLPGLLAPMSTYDGGLSGSGGTFLLHGLLPYRDWWWLYGPLSPALAAIPTALLGPSLLLLRLAGITIIAVQAGLAYAFIRTAAPHVVAAIVSVAAVGATTFVLGVELSAWPMAVTLALGGLLAQRNGRLGLAGILLGLAFLTRLDVGAYGLIAALVLGPRRALVVGFAALAVPFGLVAVLTTPLLDLLQQLVWFPLVGTRQYRYLPAPRPELVLEWLLYVAIVAAPKLAILGAISGRLVRKSKDPSAVPVLIFAALCQLQTVSRGDIFHHAMAAVPGLLILGLAAGPAAVPARRGISRRAAYLRLGQFAGLAATVTICLIFGAFSMIRMETGALPAGEAQLVAGVRTIVANTDRSESTFVGLTSNRITLMNPMLAYYLSDRKSGTWGTMFNPGITNTEATQQRMVDELRRSRPPLIYLDDHLATAFERTNDSAILGSTVLDAYLAATYVTVCDFDSVRILATTERAGDVRCQEPRPGERLIDILAGISQP